jgi:plastocyanin domain-containing protein
MLGGEYFFKPKHIIVKVNVPVEIILKKESGVVPHNIVLKAPEAGIDISENLGTEPKTVRFTPTKKGKYEFICDKKLLFFKSHKDRGMEGILEVVE